MNLEQAQKIYCIGIGGIGVSALAQLWRAQGKEVSGSDAEESAITRALEQQGVLIYRGSTSVNFTEVEPPDIVVYSDAVLEDHPQREKARQLRIPEISYAQALGEVSRDYRTIVITGTHGKSTTTAMLGLMLEAGGLDPLVIVGTRVPQWGNRNLRLPDFRQPTSDSRLLIVEGDDYRDHFLELQPDAVVITSIEWDHPDYFKDLAHTMESFRKLVKKVPADGLVVLNQDDPGCQLLHSAIPQNRRIMLYGKGSKMFNQLHLQVPGAFNRYNATAAATAALELGVPHEVVEKVAQGFKGVWRRFEIVGQLHDSRFMVHDSPTIISDYGHHPTAIRATMQAARQAYPGRRLVLVYQPHQHSRTKYLFNDFVEALKDAADLVIVSEIYAVKGRMEDHDVTSRDIVHEIIKTLKHESKEIMYGGDLKETKRVALEQMNSGDVVIFMGAGDIDNLARELCTKS